MTITVRVTAQTSDYLSIDFADAEAPTIGPDGTLHVFKSDARVGQFAAGCWLSWVDQDSAVVG